MADTTETSKMATETDTGNETFTKANQDYFDKLAATYDTLPWQKIMSSKILSFLRSNINVIIPSPTPQPTSEATERQQVTLLDYACGTGVVTQALQPFITQALGIDISSAMVDRYNTVFSSSTASPAPSSTDATSPVSFSAHAILGDLLSDPPSLDRSTDSNSTTDVSTLPTFDIVAVGLGFHHFACPADALERLAQKVKEGGTVVIVDFAPFEAGPGAGHGHGHWHHHSHEQGQHDQHHVHQEKSSQQAGSGDDVANASRPNESEATMDGKSNAFHEAATATIRTHGFSEEAMRALFVGAGLRDFRWREMDGEVEMWVGSEGEKRRVVRSVVLGLGVR